MMHGTAADGRVLIGHEWFNDTGVGRALHAHRIWHAHALRYAPDNVLERLAMADHGCT